MKKTWNFWHCGRNLVKNGTLRVEGRNRVGSRLGVILKGHGANLSGT